MPHRAIGRFALRTWQDDKEVLNSRSVGAVVRQPQLLADQGVCPFQACALVEPAGSCLMAASPLEPAGGVAGWLRLAEGGGEQPLDLVDGERDEAGVGGRCLVRPYRWRCLGPGAIPELGGGDGADGEGGHDEHEVAADRGVEPCLALVQAEVVLPRLESFFYWPSQACGPDQACLRRQLALGHEAVVQGQLAGLQVAADEQAVAGGGSGDLCPGVPAFAFGPLPGGADLPAPLVLQQRLHGIRAAHPGPGGERDHEG